MVYESNAIVFYFHWKMIKNKKKKNSPPEFIRMGNSICAQNKSKIQPIFNTNEIGRIGAINTNAKPIPK